jgi:predicted membrane protein
MTATSMKELTTAPSRTPLLAALGIAASGVLTAVGTFWDVNNNDAEPGKASEWFITLGIVAVAAAVAYGLVVRTAATGNAGRRALVLSIVGFLSNVVFWAGLPMVIASAAAACAFLEKDTKGTLGTASKVALVIALLTAVPVVGLAIFG